MNKNNSSFINILGEVIKKIKVQIFLFAVAYAIVFILAAGLRIEIIRELKYPLLIIFVAVLSVYFILEYIKIKRSEMIEGSKLQTDKSVEIKDSTNVVVGDENIVKQEFKKKN